VNTKNTNKRWMAADSDLHSVNLLMLDTSTSGFESNQYIELQMCQSSFLNLESAFAGIASLHYISSIV
jgi:hypothetical protein